MIRIQNVCRKAILVCLIPTLIGVIYMMALSALRPLKVKDVLINIRINIAHRYQNVLNIANSTDPDETPRFVASHLGLRYFE